MGNDIKISVIKRSFKKSEKLTDYEKELLERSKMCPDCEVGRLKEGPAGGMSVNCYCNNVECGSGFNLSFYGDKLFTAERITDKGFKNKKLSELVEEYLDARKEGQIATDKRDYESGSKKNLECRAIKDQILSLLQKRFPEESNNFLEAVRDSLLTLKKVNK